MDRVIRLLGESHYDVCVMTGDYRAARSVQFHTRRNGAKLVRIKDPIYGVLGNHDTICLQNWITI